jgi:hypothetical protein
MADPESGLAGAPDRDAALEYLARCLFEKMEHLDPDPCMGDWDNLTPRQRNFYILTMEYVLGEEETVRRCLNSGDGMPTSTR